MQKGRHRVRVGAVALQPVRAQRAVGGVVDGQTRRHLHERRAEAPARVRSSTPVT